MPNLDINQLATNDFGISASGYIGSRGATGSAGSAGTNGTTGANGAGSDKPKISNIQVTDSSYTVLDDTAVDSAGGYIKITGTGFASGCNVLINQTTATSVSFVSSTEVRAQVPATTAGTYIVYLVNANGSVAIRVNGITFSGTPSWVTSGGFSGVDGTALSYQLTATGAATYSLQAGSTLPSGVTLSNTGLISGTVTGLSADTTYNFTVLATDTELQDSPRTFALTITAGDQYFRHTTLLLSANGTNLAQNNTFLDSSTNNISITRNGNPIQGTFTPYGDNWSNYFDGSGDYLTPASSSVVSMGTLDFTFEAWVYLTGFNTWHSFVSTRGTENTGGATDVWCFGVNGTGYVYCYSGDFQAQGAAGVITLNTWYHVAISRSGSSMRLFVNGTQTGATGTTSQNYTGNQMSLGANNNGSEPIIGYMSNARLVKGTALYTSNFTPSTTPLISTAQTSLLTCQSNRLRDASSNNLAITKNGDVSVQKFSPFSPTSTYSPTTLGGSVYIDGNADNLLLPYNSGYNLPADFTIELWLYPTVAQGGMILNCGGGSNIAWASYELVFNTSRVINFAASSTNTGYDIGSESTGTGALGTVNLGQWNHIAVIRTGNTYKGFINGVLGFEQTLALSPYNQTTRGISVGANYTNTWGTGSPTNSICGYISDVRILKGTALYTGNFVPPTAPLTAITNTQLLLNFTNAGIVDSAMQNNLETVADAKLSTAQSKFGGSSMSFDGTGDSLNIYNSYGGALGTGNFTVEAWIYTTASSGTQCVYDTRSGQPDATTAGFYFGLYSSNSLLLWSSGSVVAGGGTVPANTWTHIALVRIGNNFTCYLNGTSVATGTSTNNFTSTMVQIGSSTNVTGSSVNYFNGYIDDLRVTKGYARYTGNFTPPASAFPAK